jgi:hypothetical protein
MASARTRRTWCSMVNKTMDRITLLLSCCLLGKVIWPHWWRTSLLNHIFLVELNGWWLLVMYKIKSSRNNSWTWLEFLHGTPELKKSAMETIDGFFRFLEIWWITTIMVVVVHHVLYCFNIAECLETTCWFMAVMPWFLL